MVYAILVIIPLILGKMNMRCIGSLLRIAPIFGILVILATFFHGIVPNLVLSDCNGFHLQWQNIVYKGPRLPVAPHNSTY